MPRERQVSVTGGLGNNLSKGDGGKRIQKIVSSHALQSYLEERQADKLPPIPPTYFPHVPSAKPPSGSALRSRSPSLPAAGGGSNLRRSSMSRMSTSGSGAFSHQSSIAFAGNTAQTNTSASSQTSIGSNGNPAMRYGTLFLESDGIGKKLHALKSPRHQFDSDNAEMLKCAPPMPTLEEIEEEKHFRKQQQEEGELNNSSRFSQLGDSHRRSSNLNQSSLSSSSKFNPTSPTTGNKSISGSVSSSSGTTGGDSPLKKRSMGPTPPPSLSTSSLVSPTTASEGQGVAATARSAKPPSSPAIPSQRGGAQTARNTFTTTRTSQLSTIAGGAHQPPVDTDGGPPSVFSSTFSPEEHEQDDALLSPNSPLRHISPRRPQQPQKEGEIGGDEGNLTSSSPQSHAAFGADWVELASHLPRWDVLLSKDLYGKEQMEKEVFSKQYNPVDGGGAGHGSSSAGAGKGGNKRHSAARHKRMSSTLGGSTNNNINNRKSSSGVENHSSSQQQQSSSSSSAHLDDRQITAYLDMMMNQLGLHTLKELEQYVVGLNMSDKKRQQLQQQQQQQSSLLGSRGGGGGGGGGRSKSPATMSPRATTIQSHRRMQQSMLGGNVGSSSMNNASSMSNMMASTLSATTGPGGASLSATTTTTTTAPPKRRKKKPQRPSCFGKKAAIKLHHSMSHEERQRLQELALRRRQKMTRKLLFENQDQQTTVSALHEDENEVLPIGLDAHRNNLSPSTEALLALAEELGVIDKPTPPESLGISTSSLRSVSLLDAGGAANNEDDGANLLAAEELDIVEGDDEDSHGGGGGGDPSHVDDGGTSATTSHQVDGKGAQATL